ncbi:MAG: ferritin-like domain-containing protein [Polyangiaceae bacterium]
MTPLNLRAAARACAPRLHASPAVRARAIATWRGRMVNEHGSAQVFEQLAVQIDRAGLGGDLARECEGFAREERTHGVLCGAVVEAFGGAAVGPALPEADLPPHDDVSPVEGVLRNVLSVACLSESVAVALIGAERLRMQDGELRRLLTRIYADEVGHARFGWRLAGAKIPELDASARERLGDYLSVAFAHLEAHELSHLPLTGPLPEGSEQAGVCDGVEARELFFATVRDVIVPGLAALGLPAERAYRERHTAYGAS